MDEPLTKAEKLNVRQDQSLRDQQRRQGGTTFFERAQLDAALEHQGRFRDVTAATVVGASPGRAKSLVDCRQNNLRSLSHAREFIGRR